MDKELRAAKLKAQKTLDPQDIAAYERLHNYYCPPPRATELGRQYQECKVDRRLSPAWGYKTGQWCTSPECQHWLVEIICKDCRQVDRLEWLG